MKVYLSRHWNINCITGAVIVAMIIIATTVFCIWSKDDEDYILIACALIFVFLYCYLLIVSIKLVRYVVKDRQQLIMCSFWGKKMAVVDLKSDVYYEILQLTEGQCVKKSFIVLSNLPFRSYSSNKYTGLARVCKSIDKTGNQIILPDRNRNMIRNTEGRLYCVDKKGN